MEDLSGFTCKDSNKVYMNEFTDTELVDALRHFTDQNESKCHIYKTVTAPTLNWALNQCPLSSARTRVLALITVITHACVSSWNEIRWVCFLKPVLGPHKHDKNIYSFILRASNKWANIDMQWIYITTTNTTANNSNNNTLVYKMPTQTLCLYIFIYFTLIFLQNTFNTFSKWKVF